MAIPLFQYPTLGRSLCTDQPSPRQQNGSARFSTQLWVDRSAPTPTTANVGTLLKFQYPTLGRSLCTDQPSPRQQNGSARFSTQLWVDRSATLLKPSANRNGKSVSVPNYGSMILQLTRSGSPGPRVRCFSTLIRVNTSATILDASAITGPLMFQYLNSGQYFCNPAGRFRPTPRSASFSTLMRVNASTTTDPHLVGAERDPVSVPNAASIALQPQPAGALPDWPGCFSTLTRVTQSVINQSTMIDFPTMSCHSRGRSPFKRFPPYDLEELERTLPIAIIDEGDQLRLMIKNSNPPTKITHPARVMSRSSLIIRPIGVSLCVSIHQAVTMTTPINVIITT